MTALRTLLCVVVLSSAIGHAQIALVQQASQNQPASGSCGSLPSAESKTLTVTPGNALVVFWFQTTDAFKSVTGGGVTWNRASSVSGGAEGGIYYGLNSTGGSQTVTVSWSDTPVTCAFSIAEFSGVPSPVVNGQLQLLMPGEVAAPGTATGKTGTPTPVTAGSTVTVTVNTVDASWNVITPTSPVMVHFASNEATATLPADSALSRTGTFQVHFKQASSGTTLAVSDASPGLDTQAVLDGGTATAATGAVTVNSTPELVVAMALHAAPAGTPGNNTFNALSGVTSGTEVQEAAWLSPAAPGSYSTSWLLPGAVGWETLIAAIGAQRASAPDSSGPFVVNPGAVNKLQVLVPGESAAPGTVSGKTGTAMGQVANIPFLMTLNAVDSNWNVASTADVVHLVSTDGAAVLPANTSLVGGTLATMVTLNTPGSQSVTVSDVTTPARTANTSGSILVGVAAITYTLSGTVSPAVDGAGTDMMLSGAASTPTLADGTGAYQFTSLAIGAYVVTPVKAGYTFVPPSAPVTITNGNVSAVDFTAVADVVVVDAGVVDAGVADAGVADASVADAGSVDAGSVDAGAVDAGQSSDAGPSSDAGSSTDAGPSNGNLEVRCGCSSVDVPTALVWWLLAMVVSRWVRRERSPRH
jgi:hypothetical protein